MEGRTIAKLPVLEPGDFYIEEGRMVFTEAYHRKRGACCESGCRHCPWSFRKEGNPCVRPVDRDNV